MKTASPVRERIFGVLMQPWGLPAITAIILAGISDSPFNMFPYLTARLRTAP